MTEVICENCGEPYSINYQKKVKYKFCKKSLCQSARNKLIYKERRARENKPPPKSRLVICLCCGEEYEISRSQQSLKYPYCTKPGCQDERTRATRQRMKEARDKYLKAKARDKWTKDYQKDMKSRLANGQKTTGKPCTVCGGPVEVSYPSAGHAGIIYTRCKYCRAAIKNSIHRFDGDHKFGSSEIGVLTDRRNSHAKM